MLLAAEMDSQAAFAILASPNPAEALAAKLSGARQKVALDYASAYEIDEALAKGIDLLKPERYPETLLELGNQYPALWSWGDESVLDSPKIAIVGTRRASGYGKAVAKKFAEHFARSGVSVVSGGAAGIDSSAHLGALEAGGKTIAVLGTGVDEVFPASNGPLFERIKQNGCLLSQYALGAPSAGYRFLNRNDLIAGLSLAVVVVEAPIKSGALNTATKMAELSRPVFVVPGTIDNLNFSGSHRLIREGAEFVDHPQQILDSLGLESSEFSLAGGTLSESARQVLDEIECEPRNTDQLADTLGWTSSKVLSEVTLLEMDGLVYSANGVWRRK